ncbi:MAG: trimethylamine methyltransferase family protein, partial [Pseudomonadota bacterium]
RRDGARRSKQKPEQHIGLYMPVPQPRRPFAPVKILTDDQVEEIHAASLKVLQQTGVHFMGRRARAFLANHDGIRVDHEREIVWFSPEVVEHAMATVPSQFRLHARNPVRDLEVGVGKIAFTNVVTPPYIGTASVDSAGARMRRWKS